MTIQEILAFGNNITEMGLILTVLYAVALWMGVRFILRLYKKMVDRIIETKGRSEATTIIFLGNVLKAASYALAVYLVLVQFKALQSLGNLLLGASSILGVAVTLAGQESVSHLVGGLFLSVYQPFRVNDLIHLPEKGITGRIKEIGMRHTIIVTAANTEVIVPNSIMNSTIIENRDIGDFYNNTLIFSIGYQSDMDKAMAIINEQVKKHPLLLQEKKDAVNTVVFDLGAYSVDLRVVFATKDATDGFKMSADLRKSVKEAFEQSKIEIPFPTTQILQ